MKFIGSALVKVIGTLVVVVAVIGVGAFVLAQTVPQITVQNQCADPINLPDGVQLVPGIPDQISTGGSATFPLIIGPGNYRLYEEGSGLYVQLPRSVPAVGDTLRVAQAGLEPQATFQGKPVTIPMEADFAMNQTYTTVICTP